MILAQAGFASAAPRYAALGWSVIPLCSPTAAGGCGCGRGHVEHAVGKAPLVGWGAGAARGSRYAATPPGPADLARWSRAWPHANVGVLLEPARLLVEPGAVGELRVPNAGRAGTGSGDRGGRGRASGRSRINSQRDFDKTPRHTVDTR